MSDEIALLAAEIIEGAKQDPFDIKAVKARFPGLIQILDNASSDIRLVSAWLDKHRAFIEADAEGLYWRDCGKQFRIYYGDRPLLECSAAKRLVGYVVLPDLVAAIGTRAREVISVINKQMGYRDEVAEKALPKGSCQVLDLPEDRRRGHSVGVCSDCRLSLSEKMYLLLRSVNDYERHQPEGS